MPTHLYMCTQRVTVGHFLRTHMSNLKHITFTGVDSKTDISALQALQKEFPLAEFGVLISYKWFENGNRYPDPAFIRELRGSGLNLALHICGSASKDAALGNWGSIDVHLGGCLDIFKRIQLNVSRRTDLKKVSTALYSWQEVIIQQKGYDDVDLFYNTIDYYDSDKGFSVLLDASGGRGIDTKINVLDSGYKTGYAGGFGPENIEEKLGYLLPHPDVHDFWVDMENRVRTKDWFDLEKIEQVLQKAYKLTQFNP